MKKTNLPSGLNSMSRVFSGGAPKSLPFGVQKAAPSYCKRCGQPLLYCATDENGTPNYTLEEELAFGVCHKCYPEEAKALEEQMRKAMEEAAKAAEPTEEDKKKMDENYEAAVKKYMEELSRKNGTNTPTNI